MKTRPSIFISLLLLAFSLPARSQSKEIKEDPSKKLNHIKINLTGIFLKNYSVQYERILNKKSSLALSVRVMPSTSLPFKNYIRDYVVGNDPETNKTLDQVRLSNFAITPEYRFYAGKKGYGRGFYIAPFYRYASFKTNELIITYQSTLTQQNTITMNGKMNNNTFGVLFGAQWALGKNIDLDWQIFGPHYGVGNGEFNGISSRQLNQFEQEQVRRELEDLDIPLTRKTVNVNENGASLLLDGPWGGIRAGLSLGFRF